MHWSEYDDDCLIDLVFDTNYSVREMAKELDRPEIDITKRIRDLGISWVSRKRGKVSRGQGALTAIMQKLLPGEDIETEHPIGERLRLDVYCPKYKVAAEYHGRQHFMFIPHFHGDKDGFLASQARDQRKIDICKDLGIALVSFRYCDTLSEDVVFDRLLDAIRSTPLVDKEETKYPTYKGNPYYEEAQVRRREYRKQQYKRMKVKRGRGQ